MTPEKALQIAFVGPPRGLWPQIGRAPLGSGARPGYMLTGRNQEGKEGGREGSRKAPLRLRKSRRRTGAGG
jgi:hypothetical protein